MKTITTYTNQYVRREGNVIDFCEYRNRMQPAASTITGSCVPADSPIPYLWEEDIPRVHKVQRNARSKHFGIADCLEIAACIGVLAGGLVVWAQFLL